MPFDWNQLPIGGGAVAAGLAVAIFGYVVAGPLISSRTVEKSGWYGQCQKSVASDIRALTPEPDYVPKMGCETFMGFFGAQGQAYCSRHGGMFNNNPLLDGLNKMQEQKQRLYRKRLERAVSKSADRCSCAANVMQEKTRISWATYAVSARLIAPNSVKNMKSELNSALRSPQCAVKG